MREKLQLYFVHMSDTVGYFYERSYFSENKSVESGAWFVFIATGKEIKTLLFNVKSHDH